VSTSARNDVDSRSHRAASAPAPPARPPPINTSVSLLAADASLAAPSPPCAGMSTALLSARPAAAAQAPALRAKGTGSARSASAPEWWIAKGGGRTVGARPRSARKGYLMAFCRRSSVCAAKAMVVSTESSVPANNSPCTRLRRAAQLAARSRARRTHLRARQELLRLFLHVVHSRVLRRLLHLERTGVRGA